LIDEHGKLLSRAEGISDPTWRKRRSAAMIGLVGGRGNDVNAHPMLADLPELNNAFDKREQRVVFSQTNVPPRVELRAALTHDDVARNDVLAAELLDAKPL
jgi:hypothetical protein